MQPALGAVGLDVSKSKVLAWCYLHWGSLRCPKLPSSKVRALRIHSCNTYYVVRYCWYHVASGATNQIHKQEAGVVIDWQVLHRFQHALQDVGGQGCGPPKHGQATLGC